MNDISQAFMRLVGIMATLRSPQGCPWDAEQTPETLRPYLVEETYEVLEAIDHGEPQAIREELGDLLLQIVFLSRLFEERREFHIGDVADAIADKLIRRHPHVFADAPDRDLATLNRQWNRIKEEEKPFSDTPRPLLHGVPETLPALMRAAKFQGKAHRAGFDPPAADGPTGTIHTELARLEITLGQPNQGVQEEAIGDLLLAVVDLSRHLNIDAEEALRKRTNHFAMRVEQVGQELTDEGLTFQEAPSDKLERLWVKTGALTKK
ncbi:MazG family protein [Desulfuromonas soudanensis]|uniref:MazG family protein n=1 Tax=Desulfuromonas soudanensis TaxID=1603606 RepID=A0A0M4D9V3_9BACT|nr:nucleoside triphosphate pyrophosphohydrolase [Desulfuromonas soudanensis]ALC16805.1 MazG family protein [Desulfuromonas soudanensis]